ncbi:MAG: hypothetical protein ACFFFG_14965 [Candidatus Thorarchaeota archaeon]
MGLNIFLSLSLAISVVEIPNSKYFGESAYIWIQEKLLFESILPLEELTFLLLLLELLFFLILMLVGQSIYHYIRLFNEQENENASSILIPPLATILMVCYISFYYFMRIDEHIQSSRSNQAIVVFFSNLYILQVIFVALAQVCLVMLLILGITDYSWFSARIKARFSVISDLRGRLGLAINGNLNKIVPHTIVIAIFMMFGVHSYFHPFLMVAQIQPLYNSTPVDPIVTPFIFIIGCGLSYMSYRLYSGRR